MFVLSFDIGELYIYIDVDVDVSILIIGGYMLMLLIFKIYFDMNGGDVIVDEVWVYDGKVFLQDEVNFFYFVGCKKFFEFVLFRQIFSLFIDFICDCVIFYVGFEVSMIDLSGYVFVFESVVNMSIMSVEKFKSDYINVDFYYQGYYWYCVDRIQFNLLIQFEIICINGDFDDVIIFDED